MSLMPLPRPLSATFYKEELALYHETLPPLMRDWELDPHQYDAEYDPHTLWY